MYQNYNYYPQQPQTQQTAYTPRSQIQPINPQLGLKGRPVSSLEEARATTIDFDGSIFYFPDLANRKIYTKQINMDGTASLKMYVLQEMPVENLNGVNTSAFITRDEFESVINQLRMSLTPTQKEENNPVTQF